MKRTTTLVFAALLLAAAPAAAQDAQPTTPPAEPAAAPDAPAEGTAAPAEGADAPADAAASDPNAATDPAMPAAQPEPEPEPQPEPEPEPTPVAEEPEVSASESSDSSSGPIYERGGLFGTGIVVAPKVGAGFGQLTSGFGTSFVGELELGWIVLPFPDLQIFTSLQYVAPKQAGEGVDARLPNEGQWSYELTQQSLVLTPGLLYRIPVGGDMFRPYVAAGARFYFNKTTANGEASGAAFGEYVEQGTTIGGYGALGGDLFIGPGSILLEVQFGSSKVDQFILRDTNNGALNVAAGYRFYF